MITEPKDFFVSYNSKDAQWAEWIAGILEDESYTVFIQAWDIGAGGNFMAEMEAATRLCKRTISVLSPDALEAPYVKQEWFAALATDPLGHSRKLVPVRVRECQPQGLLGPIVYIDLLGTSPEEAKSRLVAGVSLERRKRRVAFPGAAAPVSAHAGAPFPGAEVQAAPPPVAAKPLKAQEPQEPSEPGIPVFLCVANADLPHAEALCKHLYQAKKRGTVNLWHVGMRRGGDEQAQVDQRLDRARIILLLVSPDLLGTEECDRQIDRAMQRAAAGVRVIPVLLRDTPWKNTADKVNSAFGGLTALPRDERPITLWRDRDEPYKQVAAEVTSLALALAEK